MSRVSVLIVNWNGRSNLKDCLDSLLRQYFTDFEVILLDNGSTDNSVDFVRENYPWVKIIRSERNLGFAKGNNEALKYAKSEYIATLNNDVEVDSNWLERLVLSMDRHPEAGFCASKMLNYYNHELIDRAGDYYTIAGTAVMNGSNEKDSKNFNNEKYIFGACAGAALYKLEMIEKIGFFDEDFFLLFEDVDLDFRAQLFGYKCIYVPTAVAYHKGGGSIKKISNLGLYYGYRNLEYVYIKNFPTSLLYFYLIFHLIFDFISFLNALFCLNLNIFLSAKLDVVRCLPELITKRREIQKRRKVSNLYVNSILLKDWFLPLLKRHFFHFYYKICNFVGRNVK